jgi:archaeosine synthase beta-subunit
VEIGIGVETLNEKIRDLCINKPFPNSLLKQKVDMLLGQGIYPKAYLLFKPPFLTEKEAINDVIDSYNGLKQMGVDRINCETMTVEEHTLIYQLWKEGNYRTPWLWSIIHLMMKLNGARLYFTPFQYIVDAIGIASNCEICSQRVKDKIFAYQDDEITREELKLEDCSCKADWQNELERIDPRPIEERIIETLVMP